MNNKGFRVRYFYNEKIDLPPGVNYEKKNSIIGHFCSREEATPLLGKINFLFLPKGYILFVIYSFRPHFNINLTILLKQSKCEGLVNTFAMFCTNPKFRHNIIATNNYIINCNYRTTQLEISLFMTNASCSSTLIHISRFISIRFRIWKCMSTLGITLTLSYH